VTLRAKLSAAPTLLALCGAAALIAGCSSTQEDRTANWSPNRIYQEAKEEADGGSYDKAIPLFEKLEGRAAGTPLAQQAQLDKAYAQFRSGERAQAIATVDRFMKLHPASPAIDYALYLKGVINFNDDLGMFAWLTRQDLSERDQQAAKESFLAFKELVTRFPESRYAQDARQRMNYVVNSLAQYEVHVARYYYTRGAYLAAINRAQIALADYREVPALEEALYIMVQSYDALGMTDLRDDAKRVLTTNYPNSTYLTQGFRAKDDPWWKLW
jgi:outer membrane protein assembly factor BamD